MSQTPQTPDYKSTIRLPQTDFPMKANLPTKEPELLKFWQNHSIYEKWMKKNSSRPKFVLADGPPYANASIHLGTTLNKILKDMVLKYKSMAGFSAVFIPGWDCHGLPIEQAVLKGLGDKAKSLSPQEIRSLCRKEAAKWVEHQMGQFQRLGVMAAWDRRYLTMDPSFEAAEVRAFAKAYETGSIYRGTKPVYWNWALQTALADAEVEYHPHKSPAIFVRFAITDQVTRRRWPQLKSDQAVDAVIWTTTPWTLPANLGIAFHPDEMYGLYQVTEAPPGQSHDSWLLLATKLESHFSKTTGFGLRLMGESFSGRSLEGGLANHPFLPRTSQFLLGTHVTTDAGTGAVHTAPGHGMDDYKLGLQYGLEILSPVQADGTFSDAVPEWKGIQVFKANPLIIEKLNSLGRLLMSETIEHSYPHCGRTKVPLIFRATPQWFLGMDLGNQVRSRALQALEDIRFIPEWGRARLQAMMENRPDWCLSRQRTWGVPIPVFYCKRTGESLADPSVMRKVADAMETEGLEAYYNHPPEKFTGGIEAKGDFGAEGFVRGSDTFDVWFDSGIVHSAVQRLRPELGFPADVYLEGSDQHRGWFNTSLLTAIVNDGTPPFRTLLTHGFVVDSSGFKMSKSKGNVIDPVEFASKNGIEILRLWCAYEDYGQDMSCGNSEIERVTETYRRLRNTMRFLLGSLKDFDFKKDSIALDQMTEIDRWALARWAETLQRITTAYDDFSFYNIYHLINNFVTVDLSAVYLDVLKDRLYTGKATGLPRRSSQTALYLITEQLIRSIAPILSFLAEEAYQHFPGKEMESVFLTEFPKAKSEWMNSALIERWSWILSVRSEVQKGLEDLRAQKTIGASLEAKVLLQSNGEEWKRWQSASSEWREVLIVSAVEMKEGIRKISVAKASGEKCVRCWVLSEHIAHSGSAFPGVCPKCVEALS